MVLHGFQGSLTPPLLLSREERNTAAAVPVCTRQHVVSSQKLNFMFVTQDDTGKTVIMSER